MSLSALGPLRQSCNACGGSCQIHEVLLMEEELPRLLRQAAALEIADPVQGRRLRQVEGRCAFLQEDGLCAIHARWGGQAKPRICQQYPLVLTATDQGHRVGLDPGCLNTWASWREGPELQPASAVASRAPLSPDQLQAEERLLRLCEGSLPQLLTALTGDADAFAQRWATLLRATPLEQILALPGTAAILRTHLGPVAALPLQPLPELPRLSAAAEAYTLEVLRRMLFLRLGARLGPPPAVALLTLGGALACAWTWPQGGAPFGQALSVWTRAMRTPALWGTLLPRPEVLIWLATGQGTP